MANSKFDPTEEELEYAEWATGLPEGPPAIPWYQSIPTAGARGLLKGVHALGRTMSPLQIGEEAEEEEADTRQMLLDEYLPVEQDFLSGLTETGGEIFPTIMAFPGGKPAQAAVQSLSAGAAGQTVKELGGGETAQNIAEMVGLAGPSLAKVGLRATGIPKRLEESSPLMKKVIEKVGLANVEKIPTKLFKTEKAVEEEALKTFAREKGIPEEQLNLMIRDESMIQDFAADIASKGSRASRLFDKAYQALGKVWDVLKASPEAQKPMSGVQQSKLINKISTELSEMPAETRMRVQQDFNDFLATEMTGKNIMNFWQKLNYYINKGEAGLGRLKGPLGDALRELSPELGADFITTNKLYGNFSKLAERMGPDMIEKFITKGEKGMLISGITTGNYPLLKKLLGPLGARILAREMIVNPKMKNLSRRFLNGVKRNKPAIAKKVYDQILNYVSSIDAEAAIKLSGMDMEDFEAILKEEEKNSS
ncbi:MAG: hypothetical protein K1000chlam2_00007 [Chlamydiae bacterium]|nr:hypothetical protein [Chlamydiota bacterium]